MTNQFSLAFGIDGDDFVFDFQVKRQVSASMYINTEQRRQTVVRTHKKEELVDEDTQLRIDMDEMDGAAVASRKSIENKLYKLKTSNFLSISLLYLFGLDRQTIDSSILGKGTLCIAQPSYSSPLMLLLCDCIGFFTLSNTQLSWSRFQP